MRSGQMGHQQMQVISQSASGSRIRRTQTVTRRPAVGLWRGPTAEQLDALQKAGMRVICAQNAFALSNRFNPTIAGWMQNDEPDNAHSLGRDKGYGPPVAPEEVVRRYQKMRGADPTRPVLLNLGQ